jgi:transcriptional regulator GlxA family with amidase domain
MLGLVADATLADLPHPDVVLVPGGIGTRDLLQGGAVVDWVRQAHATSTWTTSVCTGSLVLAAAGILDGLEATTHWSVMHLLERYGAVPVERRFVEQGKVITAAGESAGIDMALALAARIAGDEVAQLIQLAIEYDPDPPFRSGSVRTAPPEVLARARAGGAPR